jgi:hypothetical protein
LKHRASQFAYFSRQRGAGELNYGLVHGNIPAKSGECADYPILTDHRGFDYLPGGKTPHKGNDRPYWKVDVRDLTSGFEQMSASAINKAAGIGALRLAGFEN